MGLQILLFRLETHFQLHDDMQFVHFMVIVQTDFEFTQRRGEEFGLGHTLMGYSS